MIYKNQKQLNKALKKWKKILRLQEWDITAQISRAMHFNLEGVQGENRITLVSKQAMILLLDPIDYPDYSSFPQDMEQTLVHELLHCTMAELEPSDEDSLEYTVWHSTIDTLAKAFVAANRRKK